jgi:hypothetical protein
VTRPARAAGPDRKVYLVPDRKNRPAAAVIDALGDAATVDLRVVWDPVAPGGDR